MGGFFDSASEEDLAPAPVLEAVVAGTKHAGSGKAGNGKKETGGGAVTGTGTSSLRKEKRERRKARKERLEDQAKEWHPSWKAANSPKVTGAMVPRPPSAAGQHKIFGRL